MSLNTTETAGFDYAPQIRGKFWFRVRETYVAGSVADMIRSRRVGAVKLDLVLRGLALLPAHAGNRQPGEVLRHRGRLSYEALHDLCRDPYRFSTDAPHNIDDDPVVREKKRTWVAEQLQELERRSLVLRHADPQGRRPMLVVLSDQGDGSQFDDPGSQRGTGYVTISGPIISSPVFRSWGAPEVVGYLCAMTADRFARHRHRQRTGEEIEIGAATWFRQADWFNNRNRYLERAEGHVAYPFSTTTIERGLRALRDQGLIDAKRTTRNPETGQRFSSGPRMVYKNEFSRIGQAEVVDLASVRSARSAM